MKKINTLFLVALMITFSACISTQLVPGSSKGDNSIIIKTNHSEETAFKQFVQILSSDGFPIENTDKDVISNFACTIFGKIECTEIGNMQCT